MPRDRQTLSPFGHQLRRWRRSAGASQLELAAQAGTTPRHVSFVETGRSRPGRALVLRLAAALDVPLRERNALLAAAGLPPAFPENELTDEAMRPVALVVDWVLRAHEPYPAWVVGRGLRFRSSNRAAEALFPGLCGLSPESIVDLWYGPGPFRQLVENWQDVVWAGVAGLRREATRTSDPLLLALLRRAEAQGACRELLSAELVRIDEDTWLDILTWSRPDGADLLMANASGLAALAEMHSLLDGLTEMELGELIHTTRP